MIASPCINVCRMEATSGLCEGCLRSLDEIAGWASADDGGKRTVLAAVELRRLERALEGAPGAAGDQEKSSQESAKDE